MTNSNDALDQSHLSSFSIRDYAFSCRTKNIKKSWPFTSTSLQLCLKHGVTDPLPPIQSLDHPPEAVSLKKPNITHVEEISYKRKSDKLASNHTLVEAKQGFENGVLVSCSKSKIQVGMVNKNPRKKSGFCVDSGSKDDHSCLFSASESMGLRTCPICKTFSSASNTTLNAHIDQCLSVDSAQQPISKPNRPRTKPRLKVKSMVDIYASAKEGTLEDLDKRNGTNWAMISSYSQPVVSDDKPEVTNKGKKKKSYSQRVRVNEDAAGIGPVYIDGKGQKLRILSKFSEKTSDPSRKHEDGCQKTSHSKDKVSKSLKKKLQGKKYYKYPKLVRQSRKLTVRKCNVSEKHERPYSEDGRDFERSGISGHGQHRSFNQRTLTKHGLSRHSHKKEEESCDQPTESGKTLSEDPLVSRGPSLVTTDLSETVSSTFYSQNSWERQVSGKSWPLSRDLSIDSDSFVANPLRCSVPVDKENSYKAKGVVKFKKAQLDVSDYEDEDKGKWESEMTQDHELTDYDDWDDNGETDKFLLSSNESYDDMFDQTDDAEAEFESLTYEKIDCKTAEKASSLMEVDPIPIPGPPGSFLPSPWDMGTDAIEHHGNSSVITSQVQYSQDKLVLTDRYSSESPVSAPETQTLSLHNIMTTDKRPSRFRDNDESCCCQRKEKALEDTRFCQPPPDMIQPDVPAIPLTPNPVLRLMGKDLMVINQREESSHHESSPKQTSQFLDLSKTQQISPVNLHRPYNGNGLYFDTSTSFYNIP